MDSQMFLESLRRTLHGKVSQQELTEHIRYYETYLLQERSAGRSEQEILEELGDPRLLARTLAEASGAKNTSREYTVSEDGEPDTSPKFQGDVLERWKSRLVALGIVVVFLLLLVFVFHLFLALLPAIVVLGVIGWLVKKLRQ